MKRYIFDNGCIEHSDGADETTGEAFYLASDVDAVLKRQASAAINGMNAAKAISSGQLDRARRLRAESNPEALESERAANAILTDRIAELEKRLVACESAMLVSCDPSHRAIVGYMQAYPDPYSVS